jgi:hypothetical protein
MSGGLTNYDKILKELQIIETIFYSQMNPDMHFGSGMGLPRYCNEIFIVSDVELLKISNFKREYTSRLEQSINKLLVINELKTIYNKSVELCKYYATNLHNHPDKRESFVGENGRQQNIESTGYYYFINYTIRFCFFEVEQDSEVMNNISSRFFKNDFRYNCKNITLANFCEQFIDFINLSGVLAENKTTPIKETQNEIMKAKDYISLIVNSYFDAQESLGNNTELIDLVKDLFQQTLLRVGKKQEQENYMTTYEFNSRIYFALEAMKECGYYDKWEEIDNTEFMRIETIIKDIKRPISRIEFKNIGDWIDELTSIPQQPETENSNPYPKIFNGNDNKAFNIFNDFIKEVTDYYSDYSFIFQKMKHKSENLINSRCRHIEFMDWLLENKFISEMVYDDFKVKNTFTTKADRGMRPTRYYKIKERYFPILSD